MTERSLERRPDYYSRFQCIGGDCEDTCCAGWKITFDKTTYEKYESVPDRKTRNYLLKRVINLEEDATKEPQYVADMGEDNTTCSFLKTDGLCWIHKNLGADYLSNTCSFYPRVFNQIDGVYERSIKPSCPEAARVIMSNPNGITFKERPYKMSAREPSCRTIRFGEKGNGFQHLRSFCMELVQDRRHSLESRLFTLGMFMQRIDHAISKERYAKIPRLMTQFRELSSSGECDAQFQALPSDPAMHLNCFGDIVRGSVHDGLLYKRFMLCYGEFQEAIGLTPDTSMDILVENYKAVYHASYKPAIAGLEHMLENYLVNYMFTSIFPFLSDSRPYNVYARLVIRFLLIRTILIGMAGKGGSLTEEMIVHLVSAASKRIEHNHSLITNSLELLEKEGHSSLAHMSLFLHLPE